MKRLLVIIASLVLAAICVFSIRYGLARHTRRKLEAARRVGYEQILASYSNEVRLGTNRKQVEEDFRAKGTIFRQICRIQASTTVSDLIKIGEEDVPWFCSEHNIYVAFQFSPTDSHAALESDDSDELTKIILHPMLEGCL